MSELAKGLYYYRVPEELHRSLLRDIKHTRWRSAILGFPLFLALGTGFVLLAAVTKGHAILELIRRIVGQDWSDRTVWLVLLLVSSAITAIALIFLFWSMFRECVIEQHRYCDKCFAVDSDDEGVCPVCRHTLSSQGDFFYSVYADERKMLTQRGLTAWRGS